MMAGYRSSKESRHGGVWASLPILLLILLLPCCKRDADVILNHREGAAFGTAYNMFYFTEAEKDLGAEMDSIVRDINRSLSTYKPDSDIAKINSGDTTLVVDHMFREVFTLSKQVYKDTDGYFDPTVGVLVNAWGFGPGEQMMLDSARVDSLMRYVGFHKVALSSSGKVAKAHPGIVFDFNAIAKGYAIDRMALMMDAMGITDYLLEVGGEIVVRGINQGGKRPWVLGVDDPEAVDGRQIRKLLTVQNGALASSGNYHKFRVDPDTGMRYVHTIDPKTGHTKNGNTLAASVIAKNCATADAYATAFMAMEVASVKRLLSTKSNLDAYLVYVDDMGYTQEFMTPGFQKAIVKKDQD